MSKEVSNDCLIIDYSSSFFTSENVYNKYKHVDIITNNRDVTCDDNKLHRIIDSVNSKQLLKCLENSIEFYLEEIQNENNNNKEKSKALFKLELVLNGPTSWNEAQPIYIYSVVRIKA